ncbi:MAG TPA: hypothetical protein VKU60_13430 [Chloroflexota bacterium]|nr:hypothetical protein [Chloroflexota bacterium]
MTGGPWWAAAVVAVVTLPLDSMCRETPAGPLNIPLHPAAERFWSDRGYLAS